MKAYLLQKIPALDPRLPIPRMAPAFLSYPHGPGTMVSNMLESIGIKASPNCGCKRKALTMNVNGNDWCEQNLETIIDWLEEEAKKRGLPFIRAAGKLLVKRAISMSRRAIKSSS